MLVTPTRFIFIVCGVQRDTNRAHHTLTDSIWQQPESWLSKVELLVRHDFGVNKSGEQRAERSDAGGFWAPLTENLIKRYR